LNSEPTRYRAVAYLIAKLNQHHKLRVLVTQEHSL
jgi:hypothetical protein